MARLQSLRQTIFFVAFLSAMVFLFLGFAPTVFAQDTQLDTTAEAAGLGNSDIYSVIGSIINVFFGLLGVIFLVLVLYAGFLWMTSSGNAEQVEKAKKILVNGVIGLVITLGAFAITTFIINALEQAGLISNGPGTNDGGSTEPLSGSLGSGVIKDHYPGRGATDIARNTKIFVTFKDQMSIESFIAGYDAAGTPTDTSDDVVSNTLDSDNVQIYATADGSSTAFTGADVSVAFTTDLKTFVFDPPVLGSATEDVNYTVHLSDAIENATGTTPLNLGGYTWTFTVGTELDLTPPIVTSVSPNANGAFDRNIVVQVDFSEAVDPTSSTGLTSEGFENIRVLSDGNVVSGEYLVSNGYKTITFVTSDACGTNSCGETIYCLPADASIETTIFGATPGDEPPQAGSFPYDGIVDVASNALDGDRDWGQEGGEVGDDYAWGFSTTNDINLSAPEIESISPSINASDIDLDQDVIATFGCTLSPTPSSCDSILMGSTISSEFISLTPSPSHEMWFSLQDRDLTSAGDLVDDTSDIPAKTEVTISHGIFLESTEDGPTYTYQTLMNQGVRNQYQNCFRPASGPNRAGGRCGTTVGQPYCCNGIPSASACPALP